MDQISVYELLKKITIGDKLFKGRGMKLIALTLCLVCFHDEVVCASLDKATK